MQQITLNSSLYQKEKTDITLEKERATPSLFTAYELILCLYGETVRVSQDRRPRRKPD